jgi:hypothetical protein
MAQGGSGRTGGKARPAGRGSAGARTSSGKGPSKGAGSGKGAGRGSAAGRGNRQAGKQNSALAAQRAIKGARGRNRFLRVGVPIVVVVIVAAFVVAGVLISNKKTVNAGQQNPSNADTNSQLLATTAGQHTGEEVNGIKSNDHEQVLFHIHAHLAIYVNGKQKLIPYGVGIVPPYQLQQTQDGPFVAGGSAFYWLHTHDETGVIHMEAPVQRKFTLGDFFAEWKQPLSANQVGPDKGKVTAFLNNKRYTGNPANIPLTAHALIQLDVGKVVPFQPFSFPQGL